LYDPMDISIGGLESAHPSVLPVFVELPLEVIDERLQNFARQPNGTLGVVGVRLATADTEHMTTETVYAIRAWSHGGKICACCQIPIPHQKVHVLLSPPPVDHVPYRHIHRYPCFDFVLSNMVEAWSIPRGEAREGILRHTNMANERIS